MGRKVVAASKNVQEAFIALADMRVGLNYALTRYGSATREAWELARKEHPELPGQDETIRFETDTGEMYWYEEGTP